MDSSHHPPVPPQVAMLFGILAVSTAAIFIRYAQQSAPSLVIAAYRLALAALILAPIALRRRRDELRRLERRDLALALLSGVFLALHFASWISSLEYTTVASSVVLVTTSPLWVALLSPFTIKEPLTRAVSLGLLLALAGGAIIGLNDACLIEAGRVVCPNLGHLFAGTTFYGDLLAVVGAIMAAAYLLIGRTLRAKVSLVSYIFVVYSMAAVVLLLLTFAARQPLTGYPPRTYLWFVLLALVPQLFGHSVFNWALRYLSAAYVSITLLGEPIGSTLLAYFFLAETPGIMKIFGAILILAGIYAASRSERREDLPVAA